MSASSSSSASRPHRSAVTEQTWVGAPPELIYDLVSDVTQMGRWSPETTACHWLRDADRATVGVRFRGTNRAGWRRWSTTCTVTAADRGRRFAFDVRTGPLAIATWSYEMTGGERGGTVVRETWHDRRVSWFKVLTDRVMIPNRPEHNRAGMRLTLSRLRAAAEAAAQRAG